ncbi:MAG: PAS domain S-box protein, partial [Desulfobacterales bacterium]
LRDLLKNEDLKEEHAKLRAATERLTDLFDDAPVGYITLSAEGTVEEINLTGAKMLRVDRGQVVGTPFSDYITSEAEQMYGLHLKEVSATCEPLSCELKLERKDGTTFHIRIDSRAIDVDGGLTQIRSTLTDITEHKQAGRAIRESEDRLMSYYEATFEGIAISVQGELIDVNERFCEIFGYEREELIGKNAMDLVVEEDRELVSDNIQSGFEKPYEHRCLHKDGSIVHVEVHGRQIQFQGRPARVAAIHDITEKKVLRGQLIQAQKIEAMGTLADGIAHDFNNLLAAIMGYISLAEDDIDPKIGTSEFLEEADKACLRAKDLTTRLIKLARGEAPDKEEVSIGKLTKDIVNSALNGSIIHCGFSIPEDLSPVEIDEEQIKQVIHSITANAMESMNGQGTIKVGCENITIDDNDALMLRNGNYVKICIEDQGTGIPKGELSRIFDPYFTTKEAGAQKGTGFGLSMTHSIVKRHNGSITVESELGEGTAFTIYLPVSDGGIREPRPFSEEPGGEPVRGKGKILVMDDEATMRDLSGRRLDRLGYDFEVAENGAEAIRLYQQARQTEAPFDVVILDLTIAFGMGGTETLDNLRGIDPDIKAIVATGHSDDPIITDHREYGFRGALRKPHSEFELSKVLQGVFSEA